MKTILYLTVVTTILTIFSNNIYAKDLVIHTHGDVFYYQNIYNDQKIVLPNGELVEVDNILEIDNDDRPYVTREGLEIYRMQDNQYFIDDEFSGDFNE